MKRVFKTLSAVLLATACLTPGLAWADSNPSVELKDSGVLQASNMVDVHSVLVEVDLSGSDVAKVKDVALESAPTNAMSSAVYDASKHKATIAVSSGKEVLELNNDSLGTVRIVAEGATAANPVEVKAKVAALEYIASEDSAAAVQTGTADGGEVTLKSTTAVTPPPTGGGNGGGNGSGGGSGSGGLGGYLGGGADSDGAGNGDGSDDGADNSSATRTADYRANGVVSNTQAGNSTGLVKTGDVLAICGIALGAAAIVVAVAMLVGRKKASSRK